MNDFNLFIQLWDLYPEGEPLLTSTSQLLPVRYKQQPAMLKIALIEEEQRGGELMVWWHGQGAARILAHEKNAFLMERAVGSKSLRDLVAQGQDNEASRIACGVVQQLHTARNPSVSLPTLIPLSTWFHSLEQAAAHTGGILIRSLAAARDLLSNSLDHVVLHGDIHHGNILDFDQRGWLAIDPKGLLGERGFDYANLFCNPDYQTVTTQGRLQKQVTIIAEAAQLERRRLLKWILAYAGLSAAWHLEDGSSPELALHVAEIASSTLGS
ncbi:aminoglycoside phosphotransferase family protein [Legionella erythra]|uniref:Aminoglycoside/hydroxyurea antibiotic resistance kinase n=1 Tax=Legionella erythra TaxID=448 RepID=A0A0W0TPR6_LEGER|nr:aminoglycoside phosphotransferase family protein [Legionella erythra]KTC97602.1 Aminoglycoside/hydroxyurea antibiotic resistance kinase [Legionella erythra]